MSVEAAQIVTLALAGYTGLGVLFALVFVTLGLARVDPGAAGVKPSVRLLLFPGAVALWPVLIVYWLRGGKPGREARWARNEN